MTIDGCGSDLSIGRLDGPPSRPRHWGRVWEERQSETEWAALLSVRYVHLRDSIVATIMPLCAELNPNLPPGGGGWGGQPAIPLPSESAGITFNVSTSGTIAGGHVAATKTAHVIERDANGIHLGPNLLERICAR